MKSLHIERENLGIELYGVQQQLAKQQMLVETEQDSHTIMNQLRTQKEVTVADMKEIYINLVQLLKNERQQSKDSSCLIFQRVHTEMFSC